MSPVIDDLLTVVDRRGRLTCAIGLVLATIVSVAEIVGAVVVFAALSLATAPSDEEIDVPFVGDLEAWLPGTDRVADLRWLAAVGAIFFVIRGFLIVTQLWVLYRSSFSLGVRLTDRLTQTLLDRPYTWHLGQNSAELGGLVMVVSQQFIINVFAPLQAIGAYVLVILALGSAAIAAEPSGTLITVAMLGILMLATLKATRRPLTALGEVIVAEETRGQRLATETLGAVREVKIMDLSEALRRDLRHSRQRWAQALWRRSSLVSLPRVLIETIAFASLVGYFAIQGRTGPEGLAAAGVLGYAIARLLPTLNSLITSLNTVRGSQAATRVLSAALRTDGGDEDHVGDTAAPGTELVARSVEFSYANGTPILQGIDVHLTPGSSVGLVGTTGSGKSTLLDVLIGLLPPTAGEVTVGGEPVHAHLRWWWRQIGVVPQSITLLDGTIADNVALGVVAEEVDDEVLEHVLRLAQLTDVVHRLPDGARTRVGEDGIRLSGGQRQRLAIARALYRDPPVLILDEGTSALDIETERAVIESLREDRPDRSLLMVAHRVSTLRDCDQILLITEGRVHAHGSYDELLSTSVEFQRLAAADRD